LPLDDFLHMTAGYWFVTQSGGLFSATCTRNARV
jgi:hypothetical protein